MLRRDKEILPRDGSGGILLDVRANFGHDARNILKPSAVVVVISADIVERISAEIATARRQIHLFHSGGNFIDTGGLGGIGSLSPSEQVVGLMTIAPPTAFQSGDRGEKDGVDAITLFRKDEISCIVL